MLSSKRRERTLSDEGLRLFNLGHIQRRGLRRFLCGLFCTDYDKRLEEVVAHCREATVSMIQKYRCSEEITPLLDQGLRNTLRIMMEREHSIHKATKRHTKKHLIRKHTMRTIGQNVRFAMDVMKHAMDTGDHQTAMMYFLAINHAYIERIRWKRPKRFQRLMTDFVNQYGDMHTCFAKHIHRFVQEGYSNDFLPSLIAVVMYKNRFATEYPGAKKELEDVMTHYGSIYMLQHAYTMPLYEDDTVTMKMLFDMSRDIQPAASNEKHPFSIRPFHNKKIT